MVSLDGDSSSEHEKNDGKFLSNIEKESELDKESSCSSSLSSVVSSDEDYFQINASELMSSIAGKDEIPSSILEPLQVGEESKQEPAVIDLPNKPKVGTLNQNELQSGQMQTKTPISPYSPTCDTRSDNIAILGAKLPPPIQLMGVSEFPLADPNRIPASVFARTKSSKAMEWSVQSNESLFSIHIGRSGDLTGFYNNQFDCLPISPLSGPSATKDLGIGSDLEQPSVNEAESAEAMKDDLRTDVVERATEDPIDFGVPKGDRTSVSSDNSLTSYRSFAFPILIGEGRNVSLMDNYEHQQAQNEQPQEPPLQPEFPKEVPVEETKSSFLCFSCCLCF